MEAVYFGFILICVLLVSVNAIPMPISTAGCKVGFKPCPNVPLKGVLENAVINGTCKGPVAMLKKGTQVQIDFTFKTNIDETALRSKVSGKIGPLPYVNFPLEDPDACKDKEAGLVCPVKHNVDVDYKPVLDIKSMYPAVTVYVKWELIDGNNNEVFCAIIPAIIVS